MSTIDDRGGSDGEKTADLTVAIRRIVVGYRIVSAGWLALLASAGWAGGSIEPRTALVPVVIAAGWAAVTVVWAVRLSEAPPRLRWAFVAVDIIVGAATVLLPALLQAEVEPFAAGYPLSSVVVAAWLQGTAGALTAAGVLAAATAVRGIVTDGAPTGILTSVLFYALGAAVLAWGLGVLRRTGEERDAAEAALVEARAERARAEEREATAVHLHDSVLQTLALIQRRSSDPDEVVGLARSQERALREWLAGRGPLAGGEGRTDGDTTQVAAGGFAAALTTIAAEVEDRHRLAIEVVLVGDAPLDAGLTAALGAVREALVNAAKHAGVGQVDVYAETGEAGTVIYVRDRGRGFDPAAVPGDRRGLAGSIIGRVRTAGGEATVISRPGAGTEVELRMPRAPARPVG